MIKITNSKTDQVCEFDNAEGADGFMAAIPDPQDWVREGDAPHANLGGDDLGPPTVAPPVEPEETDVPPGTPDALDQPPETIPTGA